MDIQGANFNSLKTKGNYIMRITRTVRQAAPEPLNDAERSQHIRAAYSALNQVLLTASRVQADFSFQGGPRYTLTMDDESSPRGAGTLLDRRANRTYELRICFGSTVSDVQLRREFFEDIDDSMVRVKALSTQSLFRNFLEFLKSAKSSDSGSFSSGAFARVDHRVAAVA